MAPAPLSTRFQSFTLLPTVKLGPSGAGSRVGGPVRLGISPAATPTPTGVFNQRFEALFPRAGALGYRVCFAPCRLSRFFCSRVRGLGVLPAALPATFSTTLSPALSVYLCANVGPQGLLVVRLPAQFVPHSTSLSPPMATRVFSAPAAHLRPSYGSG